jgi:hypothetical protein
MKPGKYKIRSFDGYGAVYDLGVRVFEGDTDACIAWILQRAGVVHHQDDLYIADHGRTAERDADAVAYERANR